MERVAIFGATSGIVMAVSRLLAERGAKLYLVARDPAKLAAVRADLLTRGAAMVETAAADLADSSRHEAVWQGADEALGGADLVLLGWGTLPDQHVVESDPAAAEAELRTNFVSGVSLLTRIANTFAARGSGHIATITSVAGDRGRGSNYVYGAAKGGLSIFLAGLRNRLASQGIAVTNIKPGFVDTPMLAGKRAGPLVASPDEVARAIVRAIERRADVVYVPWFWRYIMLIITSIPERIFKRLKL